MAIAPGKSTKSNGIKVHELAKKLVDSTKEGVVLLSGYVVNITRETVEVSLSLDGSAFVEIQQQDIAHVVNSDDETAPSTLYLHSDAKVYVKYRTVIADFLYGGSSSSGCSCSDCSCSDETEDDSAEGVVFRRKPKRPKSPAEARCDGKAAACIIGCGIKYADDPFLRDGCQDSCEASRRLCKVSSGTFTPS